MNVTEIVTRVQRQFGDEASVQIAEADVIRWINDAQRDIALSNQLLQSIGTTAVTAGTQEYTIPADLLTIRSVHYLGNKLHGLNTGEAEDHLNSGATERGTPSMFWVWANKIMLYPIPDTSSATALRIFYTRTPVAVAVAGDVPELPIQYHNRIVEYCLQQAYELDENWAAAQTKAAQFQGGIDRLKDNVDWVERDYYPTITSVTEGYYGGY